MESTSSIIKNSSQYPSKNLTRKTIILIAYLTFTTLLLASFFTASGSGSSTPPPPHPIIKNACMGTLNPSLCFASLSSIPVSQNSITFHHLLQIAINRTVGSVTNARLNISGILISRQHLNLLEKNALKDCMEMLDQTLYELRQAIDDLQASVTYFHGCYGNLKTLFSAAMTNENTCIDGFSDLEEVDTDTDTENKKASLKQNLQDLLTPISCMISNCLAMIKYMETIKEEGTVVRDQQMLLNPKNGFPAWMAPSDRNLMERSHNYVRADIVVARDGSGDYHMIEEAVRMAPNNSKNRFVIKIKAGVYNEIVVIPREKTNIMLVGDGMNSTIITGSKNFADGFSTFTSATLAVAGDKFLARDLTICNTAGPQKFQAVAVRVTSNSAFYHCNFSSYQDTLYVHSLRQFYRECVIEGTIDFIFGNAAAIFQKCVIMVRKPDPGQTNMITAQGRTDPNQNTGISLQNCIIIAAPEFEVSERGTISTFLGRPWRNYSRTIVMKSYLGELIHPKGWCKWNEYSTLDTVEYMEYSNFGPGSHTRDRVNWGGYRKNCTEQFVKQFTVEAFLHEDVNWLQSTGFPLFSGY